VIRKGGSARGVPALTGHRVEAKGLALPLGPVARLAQVEKPGLRCGEAGRKRRIGGVKSLPPRTCGIMQ
jgi:hypothetical protein